MKFWEKIVFVKNGKKIKKYRFCGLTLLRKEKSLTKRKWNILGLRLCKTRKHKRHIPTFGDKIKTILSYPLRVYEEYQGLREEIKVLQNKKRFIEE